MRILFTLVVTLVLAELCFGSGSARPIAPPLPARINDFRATDYRFAPASDLSAQNVDQLVEATETTYAGRRGGGLKVEVANCRTQAAAYALFTQLLRDSKPGAMMAVVETAGAFSFVEPHKLLFLKATRVVRVSALTPAAPDADLVAFTSQLSDSIGAGTVNEFPVLVWHLPNAESVVKRAGYAISKRGLIKLAGARPIFESLEFVDGEEAVIASYSGTTIVIIEHQTPQLATHADGLIVSELGALKSRGLALPSDYRRVGNYTVFAFDSADQNATDALLNQITYEKTVRWLGSNPRAIERAERAYVNMAGGVILSVFKAYGLALLMTLGIGSTFGGIVFLLRRRRQDAMTVFSDAGGMLRLNLDEMTPHIGEEL